MDAVKLTYLGDILALDKNLVPDFDKACLTRDFVNTKRFSPVIYDKSQKMPDKNSPDYDLWWHEQYRRCIKGYIVPNATKRGHSVWIPGRMYFYLNFWIIFAKLDNASRKEKRNPKFLSLDYFKFMVIEMMFYYEKDNMFPKSRQTGFSEYGAANIGYNFIFLPSSVSVIVAGQGDYAEKTMQNVITGLDNLGDSEFYKRRSPNRSEYIKALYKEDVVDEVTGEKRTLVKGYGSEVYCITAKDNTQAVSRLSPFFILYEEIGKWKKGTLKETSEFVRPSLRAEGVKTGYQLFIGTGGDMDESVADVQEMAYNPESFDLLEFDNIWEEQEFAATKKVCAFVPSYEFEIIDEDGNALIEESKKSILELFEKKKPTEKYRAQTQRPFYLSQMFMVAGGGFLGETALMKINDKKRWILTHPEENIVFKADIDWVDPSDWQKGVILVPNEEGVFVIQQKPEYDGFGKVWVNLYGAATDSYDKDESNSSFSKGSCTIYKNTLDAKHTYNHWVARVTERPSESEGGSYKFYEDTIKLCFLYGECENLIEYSNVLIFDYYKRKHVEYLLQERPSMVISQFVENGKASQKYGIEQSFIPSALNIWRDHIKKDDYAVIDKTYDLEMLEAWAKFRRDKNYNCDITISCALNVASAVEREDMAVYSNGEEEDDDDFGGYTMSKDGYINYGLN